MNHYEIAVDQIHVPKERLRTLNNGVVTDLAESIKERGLYNPIILRRETPPSMAYRLIAGEHRLEAMRLLGRPTITAVVRIADDRETAALEDEIDEIDENVRRAEMTPGEVKLATKRRKQLFVRLAALLREERAQEERADALIAKGAKERERTRKRTERAKKALDATAKYTSLKRPGQGGGADASGKHTSSKHPGQGGGADATAKYTSLKRPGQGGGADATAKYTSLKRPGQAQDDSINKEAAGQFNRETATAHGVSERAVQMRVQEADEIEALADWAKVSPRELARSSIQAGRQLAAGLEIATRYGKGAAIEDGNVHQLLRARIRKAVKGEDVDLVKFKSKVDQEMRADELAEQRQGDQDERRKHAATVAMRASKAALELEDLCRAYAKFDPALFNKYVDRAARVKDELRMISQGLRQ